VVLDAQFRINLLYAVDSKNEQYSLDFFVRELWVDERLQFDPKLWPDRLGALRIPPTRSIWKPDTFFLNAVTCTYSDSLLTLDSTGRLNWSRHATCVFKADFDLLQFPFDSQVFSIKRVSYAYTQSELVLRPTAFGPCFLPDPTVGFENSLWDLTAADCSAQTFLFRVGQGQSGCAHSGIACTTNAAAYSVSICLLSRPDNYYQVSGNLYVKRKFQNYIVKVILPMFIIVCLSTITYFIDASSTPARVGGTVTLVLSIVTFNLVVSQDLPKINYSTLLDWYVWKCFLFVVFAVGEVSTEKGSAENHDASSAFAHVFAASSFLHLQFACVNNILTTKVIPATIARLIDDFCAWTLLTTWCLSNLLFWPFTANVPLRLFIGAVEIGFFGINLYRSWWNWKHEKLGIVEPSRASVEEVEEEVCACVQSIAERSARVVLVSPVRGRGSSYATRTHVAGDRHLFRSNCNSNTSHARSFDVHSLSLPRLQHLLL
jgi:hypothetical protein